MKPCPLCGGRGVIRAADVYTRWSDRKTYVDWELSRTVRCGCQYVKGETLCGTS